MSSEKPSFLSQPVVKNIFMYRNGDPYYEPRRIVINQKRVSTFETLLREVTGGVQPPFGAVRNIYTPRGGHKVDCLDHIQSGEQYVAAGRERFKKLDYLHISSRKKRMMQTLPLQPKAVPQSRLIVSARFLKPIREPCPIFVVANGDVLNPVMRLLIAQRMLSQFDRILEMVTEKMGLRILGGVRSLYTFEGQQVSDGSHLESGQFYVAVGREKFKKLPYTELLFTKPRGARRMYGSKAFSLPPIYRSSKQNGNSKSTVRGSDSGEGDFKASPPAQNDDSKELSSLVREISQARLLSLRKKRSGLIQGAPDNDDVDDGKSDDKEDQTAEEKPPTEKREATGALDEMEDEMEEAVAENATEKETTTEEEEMNEEEKAKEDRSPGAPSEDGKGEEGMNGEMERDSEESGQVEEDRGEVEKDSGEVDKDSSQVEEDGGQVEEDGGQVEEDGGEVEKDSGEVEKDSSQVDIDSGQVEEDGSQVDEDSGQVEEDSGDVEKDSGEVDKDSSQVDEDSGQVEEDSREVEKDSGEVDKDSSQVEEDSREVDKDSSQVEEDSGQVEEDRDEPPTSTENEGKDIETIGQENQPAVNGKDTSDGEQEEDETKTTDSATEVSVAEKDGEDDGKESVGEKEEEDSASSNDAKVD